MKIFAVASAVAAVAAAEADPQLLVHHTAPVVHTSPLLKTIVPAATQTVTYAKPVAVNHVPIANTYVAHQPAVHTSYIKPVEYKTVSYVKPEEVKKVEKVDEEKKVVAYAHQPVVYNQPIGYHYPTVYAQPQYVAQQPITYVAQPAQKVYHAKSAEGVEHTVINKREAEAEPFDYVSVQTGPLSSVKYPTIQKTLSAYNKYPAVHYPYAAVAPVATHAAAPVAVNTYAAHPYTYTYPTYHY